MSNILYLQQPREPPVPPDPAQPLEPRVEDALFDWFLHTRSHMTLSWEQWMNTAKVPHAPINAFMDRRGPIPSWEYIGRMADVARRHLVHVYRAQARQRMVEEVPVMTWPAATAGDCLRAAKQSGRTVNLNDDYAGCFAAYVQDNEAAGFGILQGDLVVIDWIGETYPGELFAFRIWEGVSVFRLCGDGTYRNAPFGTGHVIRETVEEHVHPDDAVLLGAVRMVQRELRFPR
jgi:SOS-response transcriptional repressor LexA